MTVELPGAQGSQTNEQQLQHDSWAQGQDRKNLALQGVHEVEMR